MKSHKVYRCSFNSGRQSSSHSSFIPNWVVLLLQVKTQHPQTSVHGISATILLSFLYSINMLPSSPNSPGVSPNPTFGSPWQYEPSDSLYATLRTSGNAPTLLSTGPRYMMFTLGARHDRLSVTVGMLVLVVYMKQFGF